MSTTTTNLATSFITFTRTSNATVTDSNGFIKWAGHNLLTNSESFDGWPGSGVTITANAIAAPNGTTTADRLVEQAVNATHFVNQNDRITTPSNTLVPHTLAVFAKADQRQYLNLSIEWSTNYVAATFDLLGETVTSDRAGGTGTGNTSTITPVGNDWYLCTLTGILGTAGSNGAVISISDVAVPTGSKASYFGNTSNGLYIWGAHLYRSDLGGMVLNPARGDAYYPTTPPNLLGFTENITVAPWFEGDVTRASNVAIAPNGLQTADSITDTTATSAHLISQTQAVNAGPKTVSIYAKTNTWNFIQLSFGSAVAGRANFDVTNGVEGSTDHTSSIIPVGNGWYRCSVTLTTTAANLEIYVGLITSNTAARLESYAGTGVRSVYLWGAQLSDSASLDAYSPVYDAAVTSAAYYAPRLDYDPVTLAANGLLVEEQRTNSVLHSNNFVTSWAPTNITATPAAAISPDGTNNAVKLEATATATTTLAQVVSGAGSASGNTFSVYVKQGTGATVVNSFAVLNSTTATTLLNVTLNYSTGAITYSVGSSGASAINVGNGWWRVILTPPSGISAGNNISVYVGFVSTSATAGQHLFAYGAQLEAGSFATSYIPTGSATATRTADVASVSTQAFPYSASTQSLVVSYRTFENAGSAGVFSINNTDANRFDFRTNGNVVVTASGSGQLTGVELTMGAAGTINKAGFALAVNDFADVANGGTVKTDTTVTLPAAATIFNLGYLDNHPSAYRLNGHIRQITYIPRRLSNSELQARTV